MNNNTMELNLNELEFGNEPLKIVRFDVIEQIRGIVAANKILLEQKNVRLIQPEETPVFVWADAFKMSEVFTNYLSNAIHYVNEGGEIRISVEHMTGADAAKRAAERGEAEAVPKDPGSDSGGSTAELKNVVRVSVYNQGPKLGEEALQKVFVKFYKEDAARTRSYGGSGIGLSIVGAIQKSHGQDYGVYNVEDGVVFYYDLDGTGAIGD